MAIVESDVVLWYDIDEGSGTSLDNKEGTASFDGTVGGSAAWTTGGPTNLPDVLDLDTGGSAEYITLNNTLNELVGTANDFSFSFWIKHDTLVNGARIMNDWGGSGSRALLFRSMSDGDLEFFVSDNGTASELQINYTGGASTSVFEHYVLTRSGNNTELFKNGSSVATNTGSFTLVDSGQDITIGNSPLLNDNNLDAKIAQIIWLNKAIDSTEAASLYDSGDGATYSQFFGGGGVVSPQFLGFAGM